MQGLLTCDVTRPACQEGIYASVAESLEVSAKDMPLVRTISIDEYRAELEEWYVPDEVEEGAGTITWRLLGFIPDDSTTIVDNVIDQKLSDVWAYYSAGTKSVTIIDRDYDPIEVNELLAHEFVHAIQDQQFGFEEIWQDIENEDEYISTRSIIEGDAQHAEWAWYFSVEGFTLTPGQWADAHAERKSWLLERVRDPDARFLDTVSSFPYIYGFEFMTGASLFGGLQARSATWRSPPTSTAAIMKGYATFIDGRADLGAPLMVAHPSPVVGYETLVESPLGMWYAYAFLIRLGVDERRAWDAASHMSADSLGTYQGASDVAVVWRMQFESAAHAAIVANAVDFAVPPASWRALTDDRQVFVIATESDGALATWTAQPLDSMTAVAAKSRLKRERWPISLGTCIQP